MLNESHNNTGFSHFSLLEDRDRFYEECAAEACDESYFPNAPASASGKNTTI